MQKLHEKSAELGVAIRSHERRKIFAVNLENSFALVSESFSCSPAVIRSVLCRCMSQGPNISHCEDENRMPPADTNKSLGPKQLFSEAQVSAVDVALSPISV